MSSTRVFISYSHDSREHLDRVLALADRLRSEGIDAQLDQYEESPPQGWQKWMEDQIEAADYVLVLVTETYERRRRGQEEEGKGLGSRFESAILAQRLYDQALHNTDYIPVMFSEADQVHIPVYLKAVTGYNLSRPGTYEALYRRLTHQPAVSKPILGTLKRLPQRERRLLLEPEPVALAQESQDLSKTLEEAYQLRAELQSQGKDTQAIQTEILGLKRRLRKGAQLHVGDFLADGRYQLLQPLGRGGFATVWRAYDRTRRQMVAIKVLHSQYAQDRTCRERFTRGARKMAELHHPKIVQVLELPDEDEGFHFFVMEHIPGGDLREAIRSGTVDLPRRLEIILELGEALEFAHQQGVIHRDIKPANILLDLDGNPKLTDFDLVRAVDTTGGTRTGMMGTVVYAAPEAMTQAQQAGQRADVFGLGMTAIFTLFGDDLPFEILRSADAIVRRLPTSDAVRKVLLRSVAWEKTERQVSIQRLCDDLRQAMAARETQARDSQTSQSAKTLPKLSSLKINRVHFPFGSPGKAGREIPFRILVLGNFTQQPDETFIEERERFQVNARNFDSVLKAQRLRLDIRVPNRLTEVEDEELRICLDIESMEDFTPDSIVSKVPELKELLEVDQVLHTFRWLLTQDHLFAEAMSKLPQRRGSARDGIQRLVENLRKYPKSHSQRREVLAAEVEDLIQKAPFLKELSKSVYSSARNEFLRSDDEYLEQVLRILYALADVYESPDAEIPLTKFSAPGSEPASPTPLVDRVLLDKTLSELAHKLGNQVNEILHHQTFQALESAWRGLLLLVERCDFTRPIEIDLLNASKEDLYEDLITVPTSWDTGLYKHIHDSSYDQPGATPYSLIVGDFELQNTRQDLALLKDSLSHASASCQATFVGSIGAEFLELRSLTELPLRPSIYAHFEQIQYVRWNALRHPQKRLGPFEVFDSLTQRALSSCLALPRILLRPPYGPEDKLTSVQSFFFVEDVGHENYLWGRASMALATVLAQSFARDGWCLKIEGSSTGAALRDLPVHIRNDDPNTQQIGPTETLISQTLERELASLGFSALSAYKGSDYACFFSAVSIATSTDEPSVDQDSITSDDSHLAYRLVMSRLAHYVKICHREDGERHFEALELVERIQSWIGHFIAPSGDLSPEDLARHPFSFSQVEVKPQPGSPFFFVTIQVHPRFQAMGRIPNLRISLRLPV